MSLQEANTVIQINSEEPIKIIDLKDIDLLADLNESQKQAVINTDGPIMIIAGAGSGKTRVLTYRLAYTLQQKRADAFQLLALTFTNKAAKEMRARIEKLVGTQARNIYMGTFHSIFSRILRVEAEKIGFTSSFTIFDEEDAISLIKTIVKEQNLDDKKFKPKSIKNQISNAKNHLIDPKKFELQYAKDEFSEVTARIYPIYQQRLQKANAMDFDDLLVNMVILFKTHADVLQKYQKKFKYIMVDEYQDTNYSQYLITRMLSEGHNNICVVGDDAQSIYSFRGATIDNILNFQKHYSQVQIYKLEQNYRSTGVIVGAANGVIKHNEEQIQKNVFTQNPEGDLIKLIKANNESDEADKVVDSIREQKAIYNYYNKDFAVLYRTNAQSRNIEDSLRKSGIVYKIFGGMSFYRRKEIKDVVSYLRLATNPNDEEAFKRVINYPARAIGETSVNKILALAQEHNLSPWEVILRIKEFNLGRLSNAVDQFGVMIQSFQKIAKTSNAAEVVAHVAKYSGIMNELHKENSTESLSRYENVQELINAASEYVDDELREDKSLNGFLSEIALFTDADEKIENDDYVTLMTIHASKGLEFKSVFVVGLEERLFPSGMSMNTRQELEEERRLFYVAITRAEKNLTLSYANMRYKFGKIEDGEKSRFIDEIDLKYFKPSAKHKAEQDKLNQDNDTKSVFKLLTKVPSASSGTKVAINNTSKPNTTNNINLAPIVGDDLSKIVVGSKVQHAAFGVGVVTELDGVGTEARAKINFKLKGVKTIILKYAKLKILE